MIVRFANTHAYPGCRFTVQEDGAQDAGTAEFSDGTVVFATIYREGDALVVRIAGYQTARGTKIRSKQWIATKASSGWKILKEKPFVD